MGVHIFWDDRAPGGIQGPVCRLISSILGVPSDITGNPVMPCGYVGSRAQLNAELVLDQLARFSYMRNIGDPVLLVVGQDIFRPGDVFLFGLARPRARVAILSTARLSNEYYGRPPGDSDLVDRIGKEGAHEIGHLLGLGHCPDTACIMYNPHTLFELDAKKKAFCPACLQNLSRPPAG